MHHRRASAGFTMLELLIVLTLLAIVVTAVTLSIRDPEATQLEREAERLSALLESARAESRAPGVVVRWMPLTPSQTQTANFRFVGLPDALQLPTSWLSEGVYAEIYGAGAIVLGPDPMIGPQRLTLVLRDRRISLATDGLKPFALVP